MTIHDRISDEIERLESQKKELAVTLRALNESVDKIIVSACDHLKLTTHQMDLYDNHDSTHSAAVLSNIERLLRDDGIQKLTLVESIMLKLCCYLHDTGMALPAYGYKLLEKVETPDYRYHNLHSRKNGIQSIMRELKQCDPPVYDDPAKASGWFGSPDTAYNIDRFLATEIWEYEHYRAGLSEPNDIDHEAFCRITRQEYLRTTHGERSKDYSINSSRLIRGLLRNDKLSFCEAAGNICHGHCQEFGEVKKLGSFKVCNGISNDHTLVCNSAYVCILLRLGDLIHFDKSRSSQALYSEVQPLPKESSQHYEAKLSDLCVTITTGEKGVEIRFYVEYENPSDYYFLDEYLDRLDEELLHYEQFQKDTKDKNKGEGSRYPQILNHVIRDIHPSGYSPDKRLRFTLEQRQIFQLLMGVRLYSNPLYCLRELYQNALDACRCMRAAKNNPSDDIYIEFGLSEDEQGQYLYCKDTGTGMTVDIVTEYLLRAGNSYYRSEAFRREEASWHDNVVPVSEFGIGLLSCFMLGSRIEIITRHHTCIDSAPLWICMEGMERYGYFRDLTSEVIDLLEGSGTYIKVYLSKEFQNSISDAFPDESVDIRDVVYLHNLLCRRQSEGNRRATLADVRLHDNMQTAYSAYPNSLYCHLSNMIFVPDEGIRVWVANDLGERRELFSSYGQYMPHTRMKNLFIDGLPTTYSYQQRQLNKHASLTTELSHDILDRLFHVTADNEERPYVYYECAVTHIETGSQMWTVLRLPRTIRSDQASRLPQDIDPNIFHFQKQEFAPELICIDGIPVTVNRQSETYESIQRHLPKFRLPVQINFRGICRPKLNVNRESITHFAKATGRVMEELEAQMIQKFKDVIRDHFHNYPSAYETAVLKRIEQQISRIFPRRYSFELMECIANELGAHYPVIRDKISLTDLFSGKELRFPLEIPLESWVMENEITKSYFSQASKFYVRQNQIFIVPSGKLSCDIPQGDWNDFLFIADEWSGIYKDFDFVQSLRPLVPARLLEITRKKYSKDKIPVDEHLYQDIKNYASKFWNLLIQPDQQTLTNPDHNESASVGAQIRLNVWNCKPTTKACYLPSSGDIKEPCDGQRPRKYVTYAYIDQLHNRNIRVDQYMQYPKFYKGLKEGWTILSHQIDDGYVVAPGIVCREEMVAMIPPEVLDRRGQAEYLFTDGTTAF